MGRLGFTKVKCQNCLIDFDKNDSQIRKTKKHFCSKNCFDDFQRSDALKVGDSIIKKCNVCQLDFIIHQSDDNRYSTCSKECQRVNRTREKNPNWRGGITNERKALMSVLEYKIWRISVFERDDYTCQICGKRGNGELHAHHIKPWAMYPELRYEISNGLTLCETCHQNEHRSQADGIL